MRFRLSIDREAEEEIVAVVHKPTALTDRIERLVLEDSGDTCLTVYGEDRDTVFEMDYRDIESVAVNEGRTLVTDVSGNAYTCRLRLYELEERLPKCFIRINKSALANRERIARFEATFGGGVNVVFRSGAQEYVSRRCFAEIRKGLEQK